MITSLCGMTAAWFDGTKIEDTVGNWRDYVDIYYFTPYVTLDPNDVKPPEGLQLYKVHIKKYILASLVENGLQVLSMNLNLSAIIIRFTVRVNVISRDAIYNKCGEAGVGLSELIFHEKP